MPSLLETDAPYRVLDQPHSTRSKWKIICVGAGASGLYLAYSCEQRMQDYELTIYEKNPDIGGTWLESNVICDCHLQPSLTTIPDKYPGCACDVPSHIYTYSFRPVSLLSCYPMRTAVTFCRTRDFLNTMPDQMKFSATSKVNRSCQLHT